MASEEQNSKLYRNEAGARLENRSTGVALAPASSKGVGMEGRALCFIAIGHLDKINVWLQVKTRMSLVDAGSVQQLV